MGPAAGNVQRGSCFARAKDILLCFLLDVKNDGEHASSAMAATPGVECACPGSIPVRITRVSGIFPQRGPSMCVGVFSSVGACVAR
jgi:hypothetical protein